MAKEKRPLGVPHDVDLYVGSVLRMRRRFLGLSQEAVANSIGLTFQQLQKYEKGVNRISASKLFELAAVLQMPIEKFFHGVEIAEDEVTVSRSEKDIHEFLRTNDGIALAQAFSAIKRPRHRRAVLNLAQMLAEDE